MIATTAKVRPGVRFVLVAGALSVALFGALRIPAIEKNLLIPFTKAQHGLACRIGGDADAPISVGLSCSAADVISLCLGFILAFPVPWRRRLAGAALGLLLIAGINTIRIATLSHAVGNPRWFGLLHLYLWPGVLLLAVSIYVFLWMNQSLRLATSGHPSTQASGALRRGSPPGLRFIVLTVVFVALFVGSSTWWMNSELVLIAARWVAAFGAVIIRLFGGEAQVTDNLLKTTNGTWIVTQECIMTPLIPAYLAAVLSLPMSLRRRSLALAAAGPLFFLLGTARLLVLALPARLVGSHFTAIHGFYQVLLGILLVVWATYRCDKSPRQARRIARRSALALGLGLGVAILVGLGYNPVLMATVEWLHGLVGHPGSVYSDPQSAVALLAPYQLGLLAALWLAWQPRPGGRRALVFVAALVVLQPLTLFVLGEWFVLTGLRPHVAVIRALSLATPLGVAGGMRLARPSGSKGATKPAPALHG